MFFAKSASRNIFDYKVVYYFRVPPKVKFQYLPSAREPDMNKKLMVR